MVAKSTYVYYNYNAKYKKVKKASVFNEENRGFSRKEKIFCSRGYVDMHDCKRSINEQGKCY